MLKSILALGFIAISSVAFADEVTHDPSACPDLTGTYLLNVEGQQDLTATLISAKDADGNNTLSMDVGDGANLITINGVKRDLGSDTDYLAACSAQTVYVYAHVKKELVQTITYSLDAEKNLVLVDDLRGDIINGKGIRQVQ